MAKQVKEDVVEVETTAESKLEQAVEFAENFANKTEEKRDESLEKTMQANVENNAVIVKKSAGKGVAFLALAVAIAVGAIGHYLANQKFTQVEQAIQDLAQKSDIQQGQTQAVDFSAEKAQLAELLASNKKAEARIAQLEQEQKTYINQLNGLQTQLQKVTGMNQSESVTWKLSDADFLLNIALRKVVLDNDFETAKNLLLEADAVLAQIPQPQVALVREAIKADLTQLANVNKVDQNSLMQRLTQLANNLDDLPMLSDETEVAENTAEVSDSIADWEKNLEKSASSFLDHFIRVSDRNKADEKAFVAPKQEIYLRENIRLRLQIAILAIPRQQNELYKQSLGAVESWVRSYFDTQNENVKNFLKALDGLSEQSVYVDAPEHLQSLSALDQMLNKAPQAVEKIDIKAEQSLEPATPAVEKTETKPAQ